MSLLTLPRTRQYEVLTPAWEPARLGPEQARYLSSTRRINYVVAGRRSFKTKGAKLRLVRAAIADQKYNDAQYFACGPTHSQTKSIFWEDIKRLIPDWAFAVDRNTSISESELRVKLWNGAVIRLHGLDRPQRIEGGFWDGGVVTEYAECASDVFAAHISPMMIRGGYIDLESVPEGQNHFYEEVQRAKRYIALNPDTDTLGVFHWKTADVLHLWLGRERAEEEIQMARARLDPHTYAQEYEAEFILSQGNVYYAFDAKRNLKVKKYDANLPLIVCLDFNVSPGVAVIAQEIDGMTRVIGEVYIPRDSNTPMVCRKIAADWESHKGEVKIYGDPAGGARTTKNEGGTDWDIVRSVLKPVFGTRLKILPDWVAPRQKARINAVNSRLYSASGQVKLVIDPYRAPRTVEDFERTKVKEGTAGEIDKTVDDGKFSHLTDALGYYITKQFPVQNITTATVSI